MAYAALASVLQITDRMLNSNHFSIPCRVQEIPSIHDAADFLLSFLEGSPPNASQTEKLLISRMRDAAYKAEDILEDYLASLSTDDDENVEVLSQGLAKVSEDIVSLMAEAKIMDDTRSVPDWQQRDALDASIRDPWGKNSTIIGVDGDLLQIKDRLTGHQASLQVIPIVGMGGIGKTTIARSIYDDRLIIEHFDIRAWVRVGQEYSVVKILRALLCRFGMISTKETGRDELEEYLYKSLKGRRYLVVLDDVWDTKAWDNVKRLFPNDGNRSRVMLTTRLLDVAVYAAGPRCSPHQMHLMDEDKSWELLRHHVFLEDECPPELEQIGKMIAKNCQGLPLAVVVIGGLLSKANLAKEYWEHVSENVSSVVTENDENCLEILSLSYNHLPHHLKACFIYMAAFPEAFEISASRLIRLWICEGLLKPVRFEHLERIAESYLKDLIDRNLILARKQKLDGKPKSCSIHDLLRDICVKEAGNEKFLFVLKKGAPFQPEVASRQRRLTIHPNVTNKDDEFPDDDELFQHDSVSLDEEAGLNDNASSGDDAAFDNEATASSLDDATDSISSVNSEFLYTVMQSMRLARSFICSARVCDVSSSDFGSRLIRVVHASTVFDQPEELLQQVNLRYISLGYLDQIPSMISMLRNLEMVTILDLNDKHLPPGIWEMPQLRHLQFNECFLPCLPPPPADTVILKNLQTLSKVIDFRCTEDIRTRIPNLRRLKLTYEDVSFVEDWSQFRLNNLGQLSKLETVSCFFDGAPNATLLQALTFPLSLIKLTLGGCELPWEYMTAVGQLPKLEVLNLHDKAFQGLVWEANEDEFCKLTFLLIENSDPSEWRAESNHFPRLQCLVLRRCHNLQEIPADIGEIPTLLIIELEGCSMAIETSARMIEEENNDLKLIVTEDTNIALWDLDDHKNLYAFASRLREGASDFVKYHKIVKSFLWDDRSLEA